MNHELQNLSIGRLAKAAGVGVETIRYYQRRGLLPEPARPFGRIRRYGSADLERLNFIRSAQGLGFSLDEVAELLQLDDGAHCDEASALAEQKLRDVQAKIAGLQSIERVLAELIHSCHQREDDIHCPLIASLHEGITDLNEIGGSGNDG